MSWPIPGLLQLIRCTIHIEDLPLPFCIFEPTVDFGIDASGYAVEWVQGGDISERVVTNTASVCTARAPMISGSRGLRCW